MSDRRTASCIVVLRLAVAVAESEQIAAGLRQLGGDVVVVSTWGVRVEASKLGAYKVIVVIHVIFSVTGAGAAVTTIVTWSKVKVVVGGGG